MGLIRLYVSDPNPMLGRAIVYSQIPDQEDSELEKNKKTTKISGYSPRPEFIVHILL